MDALMPIESFAATHKSVKAIIWVAVLLFAVLVSLLSLVLLLSLAPQTAWADEVTVEPLQDYSTEVDAENYDVPTITLNDGDVPLSAAPAQQSWGWLNLLLLMGCVLETMGFICYDYLRRRESELPGRLQGQPVDGYGVSNEKRRSLVPVIAATVVCAVGLGIFVATEDLSLTRAATDGWTAAMLALFLLESVIIGCSEALVHLAQREGAEDLDSNARITVRFTANSKTLSGSAK